MNGLMLTGFLLQYVKGVMLLEEMVFKEATEDTDVRSLPTCPDCNGEGSFFSSDIDEDMYGL
jgi:hypothetical protein